MKNPFWCRVPTAVMPPPFFGFVADDFARNGSIWAIIPLNIFLAAWLCIWRLVEYDLPRAMSKGFPGTYKRWIEIEHKRLNDRPFGYVDGE